MSEQPSMDPQGLLAYQRRLVASAMAAVGRLLVVGAGILLLAGLLGNWESGAFRAFVVVIGLAVLVLGVGVAIADDYLPKPPGSASPEPTIANPVEPADT